MNDELIVPSPNDPMAVARAFVGETYISPGGVLLLRHHRNTFYRYAGDHWPEDDERRVASELWRWLEDAKYWKAGKKGDPPELVPFEPTKYKIANVVEALKAIGHIAQAVEPPVWLRGLDGRPYQRGRDRPASRTASSTSRRASFASTRRSCSSGMCSRSRSTRARRSRLRWLRFLDELWFGDDESKEALGEWFGYVLSNATDLQKMFLLVGPKRSGKGTIARVLTGLLGAHNTAAPTLAGLTQNFGLQPLIGKPLAIISDARLGARADSMIAVERLLSISGEDTLTIDRKYREPWTGRLPTRFMILTNELPRFTDSSGALASRFVISILTTSFYGRENPKLTDELLAEAPAIFNWALEGLDRLREPRLLRDPVLGRGGAAQPRGPRLAGRRVPARVLHRRPGVRGRQGRALGGVEGLVRRGGPRPAGHEGRVRARPARGRAVPRLGSPPRRRGALARLARRHVETTIRKTPDHP